MSEFGVRLSEEPSEGAQAADVATMPPGEPAYLSREAQKSTAVETPLFEKWVAEHKPLLGRSDRWEGFCYIMRDQLAREQCFILETGTLREPGNWRGDGQSTRLWQWIVDHKRAFVISVDADLKACRLAQMECPQVKVEQADSIAFMRGFMPFPLTLVYLDSLVWEPGQEIDCWMHQVAELAALWCRIPSGCLIASDDSQAVDRGKPVLTRRLFEALGIKPEYDGYVVVWRKP